MNIPSTRSRTSHKLVLTTFQSFDAEELEQYALRDSNGIIVERAQHTFMRCAIAIHGGNLERITATYNLISTQRFMPPSALLRTAGTSHETICSEASVSSSLSTAADVYDLTITLARTYARCQNACVSLQRLDRKLCVACSRYILI